MGNVLIIGSGGREHAIAWAIHHTSTNPTEIFCVPGNAGIAQIARVVNISGDDHVALAAFAESQKIDLTFVGPEAPLAAGIVDLFNERGLRIVGPTASAARLEGSKIFAKDFMARHNIPTAAYRVAGSSSQAVEHLRSGEFGSAQSPVVIKADGLAAGKGVVVAANHTEAEKAIADLMVHHVAGSEAAQRVVLEETLIGTEASLLVFADGRDYALMPAARDHKRIGENDTGPNTGGMGTITDATVLEKSVEERVVREIVEPTQAILVRLKTDLLFIFDAMYNQTLGQLKVEWAEGSSACVVAANKGYPGKYEKGAVIEGLDAINADAVQVFHAGTSKDAEGRFIATGGRVLGVTAAAENLSSALNVCYDSLAKIQWPGMQFRRDIGRRAATG
jgi:phosphoribosylamine---glycine ligase